MSAPTQQAALLGQVRRTHGLMICPVVYAELLAGPGATVPILQRLLTASGVVLGLGLSLAVWERAGQVYGSYARRRQSSGGGLPRRILADFVVGRMLRPPAQRWSRSTRSTTRLGFLA